MSRAYSGGILTLVFDDGYTEVYEHVLPLLRRYDMRAVFAIPTHGTLGPDNDTAAEITSLTVWKSACAEQGHELAAHGTRHEPFTKLSDADLAHELEESRRLTNATTLVYPGGAVDDRIKAATARVFRAGRTTAWGLESFPPRDPFALHTLNATQKNFHWWKFGLRDAIAALTGKWVIETFHRVTPTPKELHDVSLRDFEHHLQSIRKRNLHIATIRDVMRNLSTVS